VRIALYAAALLALATLLRPDTLRSALATSASALFEAAPFLLAGIVAARLLRRPHVIAYLGCGCATGPSARSLPAAAATWLLFGPVVAAARFAAALVVARLLRHESRLGCPHSVDLLGELAALLPSALLAGAAAQVAAVIDPAKLSPLVDAAAGALLGFTAASCGLGAVAVAGALRVQAPIAAAAFLCVAGIIDLRALTRRTRTENRHDALAYILLAGAFAIVALRRGDALVHPVIAPLLAACAAAALICAIAYRREQSAALQYAPLLMLIGAVGGAPPPQYYATETTLTDLFAGERLTFTGTLTRNGAQSALVRYAITCCRADAAPVVVRLDRAPRYATGSWLRVDGRIESLGGDLRLVAESTQRIAPPADPFIYR
jgi:multisubunit Na+/H+ antiporter MnhF subunit